MTSNHPKVRPGQFEETHLVASGESLSEIAAHYRSHGWVDLIDWRPIFILTGERTGLWRNKRIAKQLDNQNLIYPGDLLVIPRSRAGYQTAIHGIRVLLSDTMTAPNYAAQVGKEMEDFSERLDLAGEALKFVASAGMSALKSARCARLAEQAIGAAALKALEEKKEEALEMGLKIVSYGAKSTGHEDIARYSKLAADVTHLAGGGLDFQKEAKTAAMKKEYRELALSSIGHIVDSIDVVFAISDPSWWSKKMVKALTGADVDATIKGSIDQEKQSKEHLVKLLQNRISALQRECHMVYSC
jgi:hypothetical protein